MKNKLRISLVFLVFAFANISIKGQLYEPGDAVFIASWNVENLFDTDDDPKTNDVEFTPESKKQWTEDRLEHKLNNLTKVINYMNDGCGPDIIGFEEVENINVLKRLSYKMPDRDYIICHRDSPDRRGIDASLIYDRNVFDIVDLVPIHVKIPTGYPTRDILHVTLLHKKSKTKLHVFVNHWPSRSGGEEKSEPNRIAVAKYLRAVVDSLMKRNSDRQIICIGDFNDEPNNQSIEKILKADDFDCSPKKYKNSQLLNLAYEDFNEGIGSYLYKTDWNMIDQIIISNGLFDGKNLEYKCGSFEVVKPEFMQEKEGKRTGAPKPTYEGNKYIGGYSDHFPVGAKLYFRKVN